VQGAGKTTLLKAILNKCKPNTTTNEGVVSEVDVHEVIADGLCFCDSPGVNMQVFHFSLRNANNTLFNIYLVIGQFLKKSK